MTSSGDIAGAGVESTLGTSDAPSLELRDRIIKALGYSISWAKAVAGGINNTFLSGADQDALNALAARVSDMQLALRGLLVAIPPDSVFPGTGPAATYDQVSATFAQLYRDLIFNAGTLPQPGLLEQAAGVTDALFQAPAAALTSFAESASNGIARALGGTVAAIWSALWPYLLVAGGVGLVYAFRRPLARTAAKVTA